MPLQQLAHKGFLFSRSPGSVEGVAATREAIIATAMRVVNRENFILDVDRLAKQLGDFIPFVLRLGAGFDPHILGWVTLGVG
jgi:hypothetical protein